jgi:hypothetical protein
MSSVGAPWRIILTNTVIPNNLNTTAIGGGNYTISNGGSSWVNSTVNPVLTINEPATMEVKGKMVLNGQDLEERLKIIEEVLHIPERDVKLEEKHPKLKNMYDEYIRTLKKYRTWETLKGESND